MLVDVTLKLVDQTPVVVTRFSVVGTTAICILVHLIIATPGRILDLLNKRLVKAEHCQKLVLDEVTLPYNYNFAGSKHTYTCNSANSMLVAIGSVDGTVLCCMF